MRRITIFLGLVFFAAYFFLCCYYWKERVLFTDTAYQLFKLVNFETFNVEAGRYSAVVTQLFTWAAVKAGAGLSVVAFLFSISFPLVFFAAYLVAVFAFRNAAAGLMIIVTLCLGIRQSFFHPVTETHQALVYSILFFAWLYSAEPHHRFAYHTGVRLMWGLAILGLCWFSHPVAFPVIMFILLYYAIDTKKPGSMAVFGSFILTAVAGVIKFLITPSASYEGQFLSQVGRFPELILKYNSLYSVWFYRHLFLTVYWVPFLMVMVAAGVCICRRNYWKAGFLAACYFGFLLFTNLIYNTEDAQVMMERSYMPLALFAAIPFIHGIIQAGRKIRLLKLSLLVAMVIYSLAGIFKAGIFFNDRLQYMHMFFKHMDASQCKKLVVNWNSTSHGLIYVPWAFAVESLMYSSFTGKQHSKTVYISMEDHEAVTDRPGLFLFVHFNPVSSINDLNGKYFSLPPQPYCRWNKPLLYGKE